MKRGGFLKRYTPLNTYGNAKIISETPLKRKGKSETTKLKDEIQRLVRAIVIKRDGGCILRKVRHCGGDIGDAVLQADHLITRANSATYADTRLIVCLCRPCHGGFKQWHPKEYDALVKTLLSPEIVALWERCEKESWTPKRVGAYDWRLEILALEQELARYETP